LGRRCALLGGWTACRASEIFQRLGVARCPRTNSLEQSSRDRPAFEPSSAPSATPAIRPRGLVNAVNARPCDLGAEMLDYQKIRGSRKIITIRIIRLDQMHPTVQRIIILRWILRMTREELRAFSVSVGHCLQAKLSWPLMNSPRFVLILQCPATFSNLDEDSHAIDRCSASCGCFVLW